MLDPSVWEKPWCVVYAETIVEIYWAKIGPNFRNRCSETSNSAGVQRSDERKQLSIGRLTASHAEGHWFDPSRDHNTKSLLAHLFLDIQLNFLSLMQGSRGPKVSVFVGLPVVERVQSRSHVVEFVVVEIGVDVRRQSDRRVAHGLL